jgi:hypothetical protein
LHPLLCVLSHGPLPPQTYSIFGLIGNGPKRKKCQRMKICDTEAGLAG